MMILIRRPTEIVPLSSSGTGFEPLPNSVKLLGKGSRQERSKGLGVFDGQENIQPFINQITAARARSIDKLLPPPKSLPSPRFNTFFTRKKRTSDESQRFCSVCLEAYVDGDELRTLECRHTYHRECIVSWCLLNNCATNKTKPTCPDCRGPVYDDIIPSPLDICESFVNIGKFLSTNCSKASQGSN